MQFPVLLSPSSPCPRPVCFLVYAGYMIPSIAILARQASPVFFIGGKAARMDATQYRDRDFPGKSPKKTEADPVKQRQLEQIYHSYSPFACRCSNLNIGSSGKAINFWTDTDEQPQKLPLSLLPLSSLMLRVITSELVTVLHILFCSWLEDQVPLDSLFCFPVTPCTCAVQDRSHLHFEQISLLLQIWVQIFMGTRQK